MNTCKLKPPMSFQGGKQRVAKTLVDYIKGDISNTNYIDLCCGSGAVSIELVNQGVPPSNITMVDSSDWGLFWWQISNGSFDLCWFEDIVAEIPKDKFLIKPHLESIAKERFDTECDHIPYWLALQAGSFGGKHIWTEDGKFCNASFRNYWQPTETSSRRSPVNPMMPMPDTLLKQVKSLIVPMSPVKVFYDKVENLDFEYYDKHVRTEDNVVVFIDPPYKGTTGYGCDLDYEGWLDSLNLPSNYSVWVTDYATHSDEYYILSKTNKGGISGNGNKSRQEILSKYK